MNSGYVLPSVPLKPGMPDILKVSESTMSLAWDRPKTKSGTPVVRYIIESRMHDKAYAHASQWSYAVDPDITTGETNYLVVNLIIAENKVGRGPPRPPPSPIKAEDIIVGTPPEISPRDEAHVVPGQPVALEANVKGEPEEIPFLLHLVLNTNHLIQWTGCPCPH